MTDTTAAGATPVVAGATPAQTTPVSPAAASPETPASATDYPDGLGDAGKKALDAMKADKAAAEAVAKAAKKERDDLAKRLEDLEAAGKSEADKAIDAARKEGEAAAGTRYQARVRSSEVRAALVTAGINAGVLDLAVNAPEFATLKVTDEGEVEGLDVAVAGFKKSRESLFGTAASGSFDTGTGGRTAKATYTKDQIKDPAFYDKHRDDIVLAMAEGRIK